jgi:apolipoprotein N-acyltransferase
MNKASGKIHPILLSIISGLLLVGAWPLSPFTFLIFFAWIPLLMLADQTKKRLRFFLYSYVTLLIWNAGTTWWIWNSTGAGATGAIVANALMMCVPLWGFHIFYHRYGMRIGLLSFAAFWLTFEYNHLTWQLSWPWLTLGNVFASHPEWVQWYEFTGVSGGSLWVLGANIALFLLIKFWNQNEQRGNIKSAALAAAIILLPIVLSFAIHSSLGSPAASTAENVVVIQPNVDPYEKFQSGSLQDQVNNLIQLSEAQVDNNTRLVLWPETALPAAVLQNEVQNIAVYAPVFNFVNAHPNLTLQTGIESFKNYGNSKETNTARKNGTDGTYYDAFNSAMVLKAGQPIQFYNKSKLVPGVETLPDWLFWLAGIFEQFGGTTGGYGKDKEAGVFKVAGNPYITAPIICYESIYGEYVTDYVNKGANLLTIITNDGWWANTPGHRQHLNYARLRAIETRKWIARSANTGISAVINDRGGLVLTKQWAEKGAIKFNIPAKSGETLYVRFGSVVFKMALLLMSVLLIFHLVNLVKTKLGKR